jgi:hypothetical protein
MERKGKLKYAKWEHMWRPPFRFKLEQPLSTLGISMVVLSMTAVVG